MRDLPLLRVMRKAGASVEAGELTAYLSDKVHKLMLRKHDRSCLARLSLDAPRRNLAQADASIARLADHRRCAPSGSATCGEKPDLRLVGGAGRPIAQSSR